MTNKIVLIIEDNEKNMKLFRDLLQVNSYQTMEAKTAEEGIRIACESRPDLILMDIQLPGMNGIQALGCLRSDPKTKQIPVMAITASVMEHDRLKLTDIGFDGYQRKPIDIDEFMEEVHSLMGLHGNEEMKS